MCAARALRRGAWPVGSSRGRSTLIAGVFLSISARWHCTDCPPGRLSLDRLLSLPRETLTSPGQGKDILPSLGELAAGDQLPASSRVPGRGRGPRGGDKRDCAGLHLERLSHSPRRTPHLHPAFETLTEMDPWAGCALSLSPRLNDARSGRTKSAGAFPGLGDLRTTRRLQPSQPRPPGHLRSRPDGTASGTRGRPNLEGSSLGGTGGRGAGARAPRSLRST